MTVTRYGDVVDNLRLAYDGDAVRRDRMEKKQWKLDERAGFVARLAFGRADSPAAARGAESSQYRGEPVHP